MTNKMNINDFAGMQLQVIDPEKKERMTFIIERAYRDEWLSCLDLRPVDLKRAKSEFWAFSCNRKKRGIMSSMLQLGWSDDIFRYVNDITMLNELWEAGEFMSQKGDAQYLILVERALEVIDQNQTQK